MPLVDSPSIHLATSAAKNLQNTLQDIASNVQIYPNFCIRHPDYKPFELPDKVVARFLKMSQDIQSKYLNLHLCTFLYGIYYNGSMRTTLLQDVTAARQALNLDNNTFLGVDLDFYNRLHENNSGIGYFDSGWHILKEEIDGSLAVTKNGLRLHIERDRHLQPSQQDAVVGDSVSIRMPKNLLPNGFYTAVGNAGLNNLNHPDSHGAIARIYFNLTPGGAVAVMLSATRLLNDIAVSFSFKVLYNPGDYGRYDSGVLYFAKNDYEAVRLVLQIVYFENQAHFQPEIPLFTKQLAPGLGLAEEPDCQFGHPESFGRNRCQIIANGLLEAWHKGDESPDSRMNAIIQHFSLLGLDWQRAYLNASSEDIYTPFN
jgi:hypothetical protein